MPFAFTNPVTIFVQSNPAKLLSQSYTLYEPTDDSDSLLVHPAQSFYHPYARPRNFLTLPAELRMMMYHVLLIPPEINLALKPSGIKPKLSLGILRTCRQIYYEVSVELCRHKNFGALRDYHRERLSAVIRHFEFNDFSCSAVGRIEKFRFPVDLRLNVYGSGFGRLIRKTPNDTNVESKDTSDFINFASQRCESLQQRIKLSFPVQFLDPQRLDSQIGRSSSGRFSIEYIEPQLASSFMLPIKAKIFNAILERFEAYSGLKMGLVVVLMVYYYRSETMLRRLWILHQNPYSDHWSCFYLVFLESFEGTSHSGTLATRSLGIFHSSSHQFIKLMCYQNNRSWSKALLIRQAFASSSCLPLSILIKFTAQL